MSQQEFKGQYVATVIWGISSILFFIHVSQDWMKIWMKITTGLLQLGALGYMAYNLHRLHHPKSRRLIIAWCIDCVVTVLALIYFCSR